MICPKCKAEARDVARFCPKCHNTLRFTCPSCKHEQRQGGTCEKCGVDFIKYIGAVVSVHKADTDAVHERLEYRSNFLKNVLLLPFNFGIPLLKQLFHGTRRAT